MRFTTRHLLLLVFIIASFLGGLFWLNRMFAIDADSENFLVLGQPVEIDWSNSDWVPTSSTFISKMEPFTSKTNGAKPASISLEQDLFECSYTDHFGNNAFGYTYSINGHRNEDWTEYVLLPIGGGGGNTSGSIRIESSFDATAKILRVHLQQSFNSTRTAKKNDLQFQYIDGRFELVTPSQDAT